MEELTTNKYYRIIPVKIKDKRIVRVKEIPAFESKNLRKALINKSISTSTEQTTYTNQQNNNNINNNQPNQEIEKFTNILKQRYAELIENVKKGEEIIGTVEENYGEYPNVDPFCLVSSSHSKAHISNTKKVLFTKNLEKLSVLKILDSNLFLTLYNKITLKKKYLINN